MEYRKLGRTGLEASVIGFGAEWIGKMEQAEVNAMAARGAAAGVNIVDCWMSDPAVRSALGEALAISGSSRATSAVPARTASTCAPAS